MDFKTARRQTLLTALLLAAGAAAAQDYPARPIKLVIPYAAGGPTDTFGRAMADVWSQKLGTPVVIENRTGAGTLVGTEAVAKAAPDGYTLLLTTVAHAVNPYIHDKLGYRTEEDFAPVGLLARRRWCWWWTSGCPCRACRISWPICGRGPARSAMHRRAWAALRTWARSC